MELSSLLASLKLESQQEPGDPGQPGSSIPPAPQVLSQLLLLLSGGGACSSTKAGMLRDLSTLFQAADCQWLFGGALPPPSLKVLGDVVRALSCYAALPKLEQDAGDLPGHNACYTAVAERVADVGLVLLSLVAKVEAAKGLALLGPTVVDPVLRDVAGPIYVFAATHCMKRPWTSPRSQSVAQELLASLVRAAGCGSVAEFLQGTNEDEAGRFAAVMGLLKPQLTKETWRCNPATKHVFSQTLRQVTRPWLSRYLESVLPPSLLISDDYREENKILGVLCLHHIILNVPAAELCQFNRAQVVYHALYNHLYSREAQLIQVVLLCLLDLLPVLEKSPQQLSKETRPATPSDEVLQLVLTHMEAEHRLVLRRAYAHTLPAFVERHGILIARHLKRLERVIVAYLEICDGPEEEARLGILETLKCTIQHAWPRMLCRLSVLLKALLRVMWDVQTDTSLTPETVKTALLQGATDCLILLDRCSEGQVKILLDGIYHSCEDNTMRECIRRVQEDT
ncbi:TELO2-interacting protein 2 [Alligator mississippiensis]|uniref:TELO2-interacting protein 2 n=1 Tax=Alligator mississippiensis TaxID=8496 RepID=A0A151NBK9_ALLMI|nr:TELO2-interacting protein 2 [Alligator mississippiensis]KYO34182.1 TELO2-interacting protein 2 [Alligator mississippiensis]